MKQAHTVRDDCEIRARRAILIILLIASVIRLHSLAFGLPAVNDQDELIFQLGAVRMLSGPTLNPHWFGHPATTTMYALAISDVLAFLTGLVAGLWNSVGGFIKAAYADPTWLILPGRLIMLVFGCLSIVLTARLGEKAAGRNVGLGAAALLAIAPLHIELSQITRSDMMAVCFMLLSILAVVRTPDRLGDLKPYIRAGAWAGVAVATKWPSVLVLACVFGAAFMQWRSGDRGLRLLLKRCLVGAAAAVATLVLVSPFLVLDWQTVAVNLTAEARHAHLGATGGSVLYNVGWYVRIPLFRSFGVIGTALGFIGIVLLTRYPIGRFILLPFLASQMLLLASQHLVWERWALPMLPFLAIGIAYATVAIADFARRQGTKWAIVTGLAVTIVTTVPMAIRARAEATERLNDTRQRASQLVMKLAKPGDSVLIEHFGFDLLPTDLLLLWPVPVSGCIDPRPILSGQVSLQQTEYLRGGNSNVDIGSVSMEKLATCRADYIILTHYDRYIREQHRFPEQVGHYKALIKDYEEVAVFEPVTSGQSTRIVRVLRRKLER